MRVFVLSKHLCSYLPSISTILVEPCCEACLTEAGDVCMTLGSDRHCALGTELNTVQLSIFSHRFMSIAGTPTEESMITEWKVVLGRTQQTKAGDLSFHFSLSTEQMGRVLQRTSISTNIKERLDFSCAVFGPDGGLVSNAPHIPVHLGAMQETVQYQVRDVCLSVCLSLDTLLKH